MSGFLYYFPGRPSIGPDDLSEYGLSDIFKDATPGVCPCNGPDGESGAIARVVPHERIEGVKQPKIGYYADRQEWVEANGTAGGGARSYWIGFEREKAPSPADLRRADQVAGHFVKLRDGNQWLIPVARALTPGMVLPHAMVLGPGGEIVLEALPEYAEFCAMGDRLVEFFGEILRAHEGAEVTLTMDHAEAFDICSRALSMNYRVSPREVSALRLLTTGNFWDIFAAIVDAPSLGELQPEVKKKDSAGGGQSMMPGAAAC